MDIPDNISNINNTKLNKKTSWFAGMILPSVWIPVTKVGR